MSTPATTTTPSLSTLETLVEATATERLRAHGWNGSVPTRRLLGECAENAAVLLDRCLAADVSARLAVGGMNLPGEPVPDSHLEAVEYGTVHYWVEAESEDGTVWCELAAERPQSPEESGEPRVTRDRPDGLVDFGDRYTAREIRQGKCPADRVVLWDAIRAARDGALAEWGVDETASDRLRGYCHEHAARLLRELVGRWSGESVHGYTRADPYIQFGAVTSAPGCSLPAETETTSVEEILEEGGDHYWVQAPFEKAETAGFSADMWALAERVFGQPIMRRNGMDVYTPVPEATVGHRKITTDPQWYHAHMKV